MHLHSDAAIQLCLSDKNLRGLSMLQTMGFIHSLHMLAGMDWSVLDYSAVAYAAGEQETNQKDQARCNS